MSGELAHTLTVPLTTRQPGSAAEEDSVVALTQSVQCERDVLDATTPRQRAAALIRWALWCADADYARTASVAERAYRAALSVDNPVLRLRATYAQLIAEMRTLSRANAGAATYKKLVALSVEFTRRGLYTDAAWCDLAAGSMLAYTDDVEGAVTLIMKARDVFCAYDNYSGEARCLYVLAEQHRFLGCYDEATPLYSRSIELARSGSRSSTEMLGWVRRLMAYADFAYSIHEDGISEDVTSMFVSLRRELPPLQRTIRSLGYMELRCDVTALSAMSAAVVGEREAAYSAVEETLSLAEEGSREAIVTALHYAGTTYLTLGDDEKARRCLRAAWARRKWCSPMDEVCILRRLVVADESAHQLADALEHHRALLRAELKLRTQAREFEQILSQNSVYPRSLAGQAHDNAEEHAKNLLQANRQLQAEQEQLKEIAYTDAVTGIGNRRRFDMLVERESVRAEVLGQPLSMLLLDIDWFKSINDRFGHSAGDAVLRGVATAIAEVSRKDDAVMRVGGEEFAVLLSNTETSAAMVIATRVCEAVRSLDLSDICPGCGVTVSIGVAGFAAGQDPAGMYIAADRALYHAKETGRDRVCVAPGYTTAEERDEAM